MTTKLETPVPLSFPIPVLREGRAAESVSTLTVKRPRTRHVKTLAALIGPALLGAVLAGEGETIDTKVLATQLAPELLSLGNLDAFQALVADLCGITTDEAGEIDPLDFIEVLKALFGFFGGFPSLGSLSSPLT